MFIGNDELKLASIDPMYVETLKIVQNRQNAIDVELIFNKNKLYGLKSSKIIKASGFDKNPDGKNMEFVAEMPVLTIISNYRMKGQALLVPIEGNGRSNITLGESLHFFLNT